MSFKFKYDTDERMVGIDSIGPIDSGDGKAIFLNGGVDSCVRRCSCVLNEALIVPLNSWFDLSELGFSI